LYKFSLDGSLLWKNKLNSVYGGTFESLAVDTDNGYVAVGVR